MLQWVNPEAHKRLKAFSLHIQSADGKVGLPCLSLKQLWGRQVKRDLALKHQGGSAVTTFLLDSLPSATSFTVSVSSVCVFETLKTMSDAETIVFQTRPEPPSNLNLEARSPNSLTVKWENPALSGQHVNHRHRLSIEAPDISYAAEYFIPGDKNTFNFSKLPEIVGTGEKYTVKVEYLVVPVGSDQEVNSEPLKKVFTTKPLAPTNLKLLPESGEISWTRSSTPRVRSYKVRWKGEEGRAAEEVIVPVLDEANPVSVFRMKVRF